MTGFDSTGISRVSFFLNLIQTTRRQDRDANEKYSHSFFGYLLPALICTAL